MEQTRDEQEKILQEKLKNMSPEELAQFQKQQCIFCQMVAGKIPTKKVFEDAECLAILDIRPAAAGHVLIFPKEHYAILPQLPDALTGHLFAVGQAMSRLLLKKMRVEGTTLFVANGLAAGQRAQHFLLHVIPRKEGDGLLAVEEKFVSAEQREPLRVALTNRLNSLLGIKTEIVAPEAAEKKGRAAAGKTEEKDEGSKKGSAGEERNENVEETKGEKKGGREEVSLDDIAKLFQ